MPGTTQTIKELYHAPVDTATPRQIIDAEGNVYVSGHIRFSQVAAPTTAPTAVAGTGGSMAAGNYKYSITYVTNSGETELGTQTGSIAVGANGSVALSNIPVGTNVNVTGRKIYRNKLASPGDFFLVATLGDNATTSFVDTKSDAQIGASRYTYTTNSTAGNQYMGNALISRISPSETGFGFQSLPTGTGFGNAAFGDGAMQFNSSGYYCVAMGEYALRGNSVGIANTAIGAWCLMGGNVTGLNNSAVGFGCLQSVTSGSTNTGLGSGAGQAVLTGTGNIYIGYNSGNYPSSSPDNRSVSDNYCGYIGYQAGRSVSKDTTLTNAWALGKNAQTATSNSLTVGGSGTDAMSLIVTDRYIYIGDPNTDGSWRFVATVAGNLAFEKRVAGVWTQKGVFNG